MRIMRKTFEPQLSPIVFENVYPITKNNHTGHSLVTLVVRNGQIPGNRIYTVAKQRSAAVSIGLHGFLKIKVGSGGGT